jgi:hypothetical protein
MSIKTFDETEALEAVDQIVGKSQYVNYISRQAYKSIEEALKKSLERSRVVIPVTDPARVILRGTTFQMLLDGIRNYVGPDEHKKLLRILGEEIGESFGHALIETLKQKGRLPRTSKTILVVWSIFDSSARWGDITVDLFDETRKRAEIRVSKNFLASGYEHDRHRHCSFFEGYIMGVANQAFMEWGRWVKELYPSSSTLLCESIMETQQNENCIFSMKFKEEELTGACDRLVKAIKMHDNGKWEESIKLSSESLETALKEKVAWTNGKFSFSRALTVFPKVAVILPSSDQAIKFNKFAGEVARHKLGRAVTDEDSHAFVIFARRFITELEEIRLEERLRTLVKRSIQTDKG